MREGVLPYLGMVGRFHGDDPRFCDWRSDLIPIVWCRVIYFYLQARGTLGDTPFKLPQDHDIFQRLLHLLITGNTSALSSRSFINTSQWGLRNWWSSRCSEKHWPSFHMEIKVPPPPPSQIYF